MLNITYNDNYAQKHFLLVQAQLETRLANIIKSRSVTISKKKYSVDNVLLAYLKTLQTGTNLQDLITARPDKFKKIIKSIKFRIPTILDKTTSSNRVLYNLFVLNGYDNDVFNKLNFIELIATDTCLYCNRSYTYSLEKKKKIKPQIDHFLPKSKYPFFGLSYYNLVPSCLVCNGLDAKHELDPIMSGVRNPYVIKKNDFVFRYNMKSGNILNNLKDPSSIELKFAKKIHGNIQMFKLQELYDKHKDHVLELIVLSQSKYSETYRNYLRSYRSANGLKFSDNEIDRMIVSNYVNENELHKRPLAKLYRDIAKQLGLIP